MRKVEEIFKSTPKVKAFARFWEVNGDYLKLGGQHALLDLVEDPKADLPHSELSMYKKGQSDIINLFLNAWTETQEK
jgi:hypothetical protein